MARAIDIWEEDIFAEFGVTFLGTVSCWSVEM